MNLVYDGSFEGFLSLIFEVYQKKLHVESIYTIHSSSLLSFDAYEITTDEKCSQRVFKALQEKFAPKHCELIQTIFLCDESKDDKKLLEYVILGFKNPKHLYDINLSCVFQLRELQKEYFSLVHKMNGFVRFEELEDKTLYASIETKFNILPYLGKHFLKRLASCNFIIHDRKRKLAFVKSEEKIDLLPVADFKEPSFSDAENNFKQLWKTFFKNVAIKERENKKLQQSYVPLLYRKYMSEFTPS
jgi:probable DNA metabolism protein